MKRYKSIIEKASILSFLLLLYSCATTQIQQESGPPRTIDMGSYTVNVPPGDDWQIKIEKEKGIVQFVRLKKWWTGKILGSTFIQVFKNELAPQGWHFSEEEIADDYRNNEEKIMIEEGVKKGLYELTDVKKGITTIDGKKLYTMSYKTTKGTFLGTFVSGSESRRAQEAILYLYFPTDFKKRHIFYGFLISEDYERGALVKVDFKQIYPVINSFKIKE